MSWSQLSDYDYIAVGRSRQATACCSTRRWPASQRPQAIYETQHVTTMLGLVEAGLGVAAVPSMAMPGPTIRCW